MGKYVSETLRSFVDRKLAVGTSALITKDGMESFSFAGVMDHTAKRPFSRDTVMRIYSMTKPITAVAVLQLIENGRFTLETKLSSFIPEWKETKVCVLREGKITLEPAKREITVFDLMTMTSGIPYPPGAGEKDPVLREIARHYRAMNRRISEKERTAPLDTLESVRQRASCPLCFHPGESWKYGFSADVLGGLIQTATGNTPYEYMKKHIFDPLGMKETWFRVPKEAEHRIAPAYFARKNGLIRQPKADITRMPPEGGFESCGGGLFSTADDITRFARMLLHGGILDGKRILSENSVRQMTQNQVNETQRAACKWADEAGYGYGFLVRVMTDPEKSSYRESTGSFGWNGYAGTSVRIDPARGTTLVFGIQHIPPQHENYLPALSEAMEKDLAEQ